MYRTETETDVLPISCNQQCGFRVVVYRLNITRQKELTPVRNLLFAPTFYERAIERSNSGLHFELVSIVSRESTFDEFVELIMSTLVSLLLSKKTYLEKRTITK
jgi:hypothetical protein